MDRALLAIFIGGIFAVCNATAPVSASTQNWSVLIGWPLVSLMSIAQLQRLTAPGADASLSIGALIGFYFQIREQATIENTAVFTIGFVVTLLVWVISVIRAGYFAGIPKWYKEMLAVWKSGLRT